MEAWARSTFVDVDFTVNSRKALLATNTLWNSIFDEAGTEIVALAVTLVIG